MLNVNKGHVKECELPVALPIHIQVLHFTSRLSSDFRIASKVFFQEAPPEHNGGIPGA
jgi:hypothetical protein